MPSNNDLIIGMGEVGNTLYTLFTSRGINVSGVDKDTTKSKGIISRPNVLHICLPFSDSFVTEVVELIDIYKPGFTIIHSSVKPLTTKMIQRYSKTSVIYSPVRGIHKRFLSDVLRYTKFYSNEHDDPIVDKIFKDRFQKSQSVTNPTTLEIAKVCVDTTYYGLLIAYRKYVDNYCEQFKIDPNQVWEFAKEVQEFLGNRPIMYNDRLPIGGHCIVPNLELLIDGMDDVKKIITEWSKL